MELLWFDVMSSLILSGVWSLKGLPFDYFARLHQNWYQSVVDRGFVVNSGVNRYPFRAPTFLHSTNVFSHPHLYLPDPIPPPSNPSYHNLKPSIEPNLTLFPEPSRFCPNQIPNFPLIQSLTEIPKSLISPNKPHPNPKSQPQKLNRTQSQSKPWIPRPQHDMNNLEMKYRWNFTILKPLGSAGHSIGRIGQIHLSDCRSDRWHLNFSESFLECRLHRQLDRSPTGRTASLTRAPINPFFS